jgi:hypothetical protein
MLSAALVDGERRKAAHHTAPLSISSGLPLVKQATRVILGLRVACGAEWRIPCNAWSISISFDPVLATPLGGRQHCTAFDETN